MSFTCFFCFLLVIINNREVPTVTFLYDLLCYGCRNRTLQISPHLHNQMLYEMISNFSFLANLNKYVTYAVLKFTTVVSNVQWCSPGGTGTLCIDEARQCRTLLAHTSFSAEHRH